MSETISYSSGKAPEPENGLVRRAREWSGDHFAILDDIIIFHADVPHEIICGYLQASAQNVVALCDALEERERENATFKEASRALLELMTDYYFHADDPELEAVNRLRRLVGMRDQLPKHLEAELQADEAEQGEKHDG